LTRQCGGRARALCLAAVLTVMSTAANGAAAQSPAATPFLAADHWAVRAVRTLAAAGAVPAGVDIGARALRVSEVARAFAAAAAADLPVSSLARDYHARLAEEFGAWADSIASPWTVRTGASGGVAWFEGEVATGIGYSNIDDWTGTEPFADRTGFAASAEIGASAGRHLALSLTPAVLDGDAELAEAQVVVEAGPIGAWGGRRRPGFGVGFGGSVVLSADVPLEGGGLYLARPVRLPWVLRHLGPVRFETFLSRVENGDVITDPWLWGARGSIAPHERLTFSVNRAAMFGGDGNAPITLKNVLLTLVGEHAGAQGEFANQLLSADIRWRPPLGALPLEVYGEWGIDDSSGGYWRSPAVLAGVHLAAVPGAPMLSLGVERASFAAASFKNTMWYRNVWLRGGWTHERRVLGHPLGGHGTEWLLHGRASLLEARVRVGASLALRDRAKENLFAPERMGGSTVTSLDVALRLAGRIDVAGGVRYEDGQAGWTETRAFTAVRVWWTGAPTAGAGPTSQRRVCPGCSR